MLIVKSMDGGVILIYLQHLLKWSLFATLFAAFSASANISYDKPTKENVPFKLAYSAIELEQGKLYLQLLNELSKGTINRNLLKKLVDGQKEPKSTKEIFQVMSPVLARLEEVTGIYDQESFFEKCRPRYISYEDYVGSVVKRFDLNLDKYCRETFLKELAKTSLEEVISENEFKYLKSISPYLVNDSNQESLIALLAHTKDNKTVHEKISDVLIDEFVKNNIRPHKKILKNIRVNSVLNKFLKDNLSTDKNVEKTFQREFSLMMKSAQEVVAGGDYISAKKIMSSALVFYQKNKKYIEIKRAWVDTTSAAKAFYYLGRDAEAIEMLAEAYKIAPAEEFSEASFYLLWPHLINKDYVSMKESIDKYKMEKDFDKFHSKLKYWIAYALLKTGDVNKANDYFHKTIETSPYSFYSIISLKELASQNKTAKKDEIILKLVKKNEVVEYSVEQLSNELKNTLKRFSIWNELGSEALATLEIRNMESFSKEDTFKDKNFAKSVSSENHREFMVLNLIKLVFKQKNYLAAFKLFQNNLAENSQGINVNMIKYIFPWSYLNIIKKNNGPIDPLIIISLIRQESAFNPEATSTVGAKGLMQLMPETAKRFNRRLKTKQLNDPEVNVAIGIKYFKQLLSKFDGNLIYALASYNAGENRIYKWRREIFRNDDPLATIESIPFEETRNYVKLIYRNNFFYSLLSDRLALNTPIDESFKVTFNSK